MHPDDMFASNSLVRKKTRLAVRRGNRMKPEEHFGVTTRFLPGHVARILPGRAKKPAIRAVRTAPVRRIQLERKYRDSMSSRFFWALESRVPVGKTASKVDS